MEALEVLGACRSLVGASDSGRRDLGTCEKELLNQQAERNRGDLK